MTDSFVSGGRAARRAGPCLLSVGGLALLSACGEPAGTNAAVGPAEAEARVDDGIVAGPADAPLRLDEVRDLIAVQLYELEQQQHRALRDATIAEVLTRIDAGEMPAVTELRLDPPEPPRLPVTADQRRLRSGGPQAAGSAPVEVVVFCNFESPHCARSAARLEMISMLYSSLVAIGVRDLILPFHVNAPLAAEASRCALAEDRFWPFYDAMYAGSGALDRRRIERAASMALLDAEDFDDCLTSGRFRQDLDEDAGIAEELRLDSVPTVFVNGIYTGREADNAELIRVIEQELARLSLESPRDAPDLPASTADIRLGAILHSDVPGQGIALADVAGNGFGLYREGDPIAGSTVIGAVRSDGLALVTDGVWRLLPFRPGGAAATADSAVSRQPASALPITLQRTEILRRLVDRTAVDAALEPAALRVDGYRLLRVTTAEPESIYALLGLEPGDVLITVNEQPVHEAENPLWQALEREREVRLGIIRRGGLAQNFRYSLED